nr:hypothetical protein [Providencia rettgeri]
MDTEHKLTDLTHEQLIELMLQNPSVQEEYERLESVLNSGNEEWSNKLLFDAFIYSFSVN